MKLVSTIRGSIARRTFAGTLRLTSLCLLLLIPIYGQAQSPAPLAHPDLLLGVSGYVNAVVILPDGSTVFGGSFSEVNGISRANIAKLDASGVLDPNWNPSADREVNALATNSSGNVFVGGKFLNIGGQARKNIAKLTGGGGGAADPDWNPSATLPVYALATDTSGNVYVGGQFGNIGGLARLRIAKLSGSGSGVVDVTWDPSADEIVYALATDGSGNVYVGGGFSNIGGQERLRIAKVSGSGNGIADPNWNPSVEGSSWNSGVWALATDTSGNVYAGGSFSTIGGQSRNYIAKLSGSDSGAADPVWNPSPDKAVNALATDTSGNIYVGGHFSTIGGQARSFIAKLSSIGSGNADPGWNPSANYFVSALAISSGGHVYAGGAFSAIGGQTRSALASLSDADGSVVGGANLTLPGAVNTFVVQPSGGIIVGGAFDLANGLARSNILRLEADGTLDLNWNPAADDEVWALATDASGNVFAGGEFWNIGGQARNYIAKLSGSGNGTAVPDWNPSADDEVYALATDGSGNVYAGGEFWNIGGQARDFIAKLSGTGSGAADANWNPSADARVWTIATGPGGNVYVGGIFTNIGGKTRNYIAKLSSTGTGRADANWNPSANNTVWTFAFDPSGDVYAGGGFLNIGGQARKYIAKLTGTGSGTADPDWNPSADGWVNALVTDPSGNVYVGGDFWTIGGQARKYIAKLSGIGSGTADPIWNPSADDAVWALATDLTGNIYAGGIFSAIGGQQRANLAALPGVANQPAGIFRNGFEDP